MFRSKAAVTDHMNWDSICGNLGDQNVKQDVVKIAINKDMTVLGVNCSELIDRAVFERRQRRTRCGVCWGCGLEADCGACRVCAGGGGRRRTQCVKRSCLTPVPLYRPRQARFTPVEGEEETGPSEQETCITMNADVIQM